MIKSRHAIKKNYGIKTFLKLILAIGSALRKFLDLIFTYLFLSDIL
jgi:hypothetical protein